MNFAKQQSREDDAIVLHPKAAGAQRYIDATAGKKLSQWGRFLTRLQLLHSAAFVLHVWPPRGGREGQGGWWEPKRNISPPQIRQCKGEKKSCKVTKFAPVVEAPSIFWQRQSISALLAVFMPWTTDGESPRPRVSPRWVVAKPSLLLFFRLASFKFWTELLCACFYVPFSAPFVGLVKSQGRAF